MKPYRHIVLPLESRFTRQHRLAAEPLELLSRPITCEDGYMKNASRFSPEVHERAVRMVQEHQGEYPYSTGVLAI
jgi:hypothetical protein